MATHQAHRLPWTTLADVYASVTIQDGRYRYVKTEAKEKQIVHFARCLVDALKEFAATDTRSPVDEDGNSLDPTTWGIRPYGAMSYTGYYESLLSGYVQLHLLLLDADKFVPILQHGSKWLPHYIKLLCGQRDGGHPEWMARRLLPAMKDLFSSEHKPMTAEMQQTTKKPTESCLQRAMTDPHALQLHSRRDFFPCRQEFDPSPCRSMVFPSPSLENTKRLLKHTATNVRQC